MEPINRYDSIHLAAAQGWLGLGNVQETQDELECISDSNRFHPEVLSVRYRLYVMEEKWGLAFEMARILCEKVPADPLVWVDQAYALRRMKGGGLKQAYKVLRPAADRFPNEPQIPYDLACYACQMGKLNVAKEWLVRAFDIGDPATIKQMATVDPDLQPFWTQGDGDKHNPN